jgi:prepilin-type N-terminal cleavage/methylation domain-containing protein
MRTSNIMRERPTAKGFSFVEMVVVIAIIGTLASLGYSALLRGRTTSKEAACQSNLKQISAALGLYYNACHHYPGDDLPGTLTPYTEHDSDLFICPADPDPQGDSYSAFYVARNDQSTVDYLCGCPRHADEASTVTLFSSTSTHVLRTEPVHWNGQPVAPGTSVGAGLLSFGDGSTVLIPSDLVVRLVQSFRLHDGRHYSLIALDVNETGAINVEVTPGSRFEVVTPSAIAGVQGTRFCVVTGLVRDDYVVGVHVKQGAVAVKHRWTAEPPRVLKAGQRRLVKMHRAKIRRLFRKRWQRRRVEYDDDWRYENNDSADDLGPSGLTDKDFTGPSFTPPAVGIGSGASGDALNLD